MFFHGAFGFPKKMNKDDDLLYIYLLLLLYVLFL